MKKSLLIFSALLPAFVLTSNAYSLESTRSEAKDLSVSGVDSGCGYPQRVRDGLHPYQYFCMAKVYLSDFRLEMANACLAKLKACDSTKENAAFVSILENCYMPKESVPKEALERLNQAAELLVQGRMGDNEKVLERRKMFRELVDKYPNFEWSYFLEATYGPFMGSNSGKDALKKVLSINPNNVEALANLAEVYRGNEWAEAYQCARKAKELDPGRSGIDVEFYADVVATRNGKKREHDCPEEHQRSKDKRKTSQGKLSERKYVEKAYKFIDKAGRKAFYVGPNVNVTDKFSDGLLLVNASDGNGGNRWNDVQYWNKQGDLAFSFNYGDALSATEGLCAVQKDDAAGRTRWGFVDHQGKTIIPPSFSEVIPFRNGLSAVKVSVSRPFFMNDKWGFVDSKGVMQVEPIYDHCLPIADGLAPVVINGKVGFIDKDGFFAIPPKFDYARPFSEGVASVMLWNVKTRTLTHQYIKRSGDVAFSIDYKIAKNQSVSDVFDVSYYLYPEQYSFQLGERLKYRWSDFHNGLVARRVLIKPKVWKAGFMDIRGQFVIAPDFDKVEAFSEGLAKVKVGNQYGYINTKGERVIPVTYTQAKDFSDGMAAVSTDGETWGYIDKTGKMIVAEKYLEANSFSEGLAKVGVAK